MYNDKNVEYVLLHDNDGLSDDNDIIENVYHILFNIDAVTNNPIIVRNYNNYIKTNDNTNHNTLL